MAYNRGVVKHLISSYTVNFGPQHPAAHGVLRLLLELDGEVVRRADVHLGLLHRGTERLMLGKTYQQGLPYMDRLDYVSMMSQEHTYVLCMESLLNVYVPRRSQVVRVLLLELTRLLNHLLCISSHALDVGAMTGYFWGFEEREKLLEFYERVSGARMHAAYFQVGGIRYDLPVGFSSDVYSFCEQFLVRLDEIEELLTQNRIWNSRLRSVGVVTEEVCRGSGFTGVMLRSSGVCWDLRKSLGYEVYPELRFGVPVGRVGDCYDRYLLRLEEMRESVHMIVQCLNKLPRGSVNSVSTRRHQVKSTMEKLIEHFRTCNSGLKLSGGCKYIGTEAPKGEFGVFIRSDGSAYPRSVKLRSPGLLHIGGIEYMVRDHVLSDVVTVIGSQDLVFGEIDR